MIANKIVNDATSAERFIAIVNSISRAYLHNKLSNKGVTLYERFSALAENDGAAFELCARYGIGFLIDSKMIQSVPVSSREGAEEIINHMLEYDYNEEYLGECADDDLPQVIANIKHYRGILKHAKYNSTEYREYTDKLAELYSQLLKYDYENCEDILFDCEEAFVVERGKERKDGRG